MYELILLFSIIYLLIGFYRALMHIKYAIGSAGVLSTILAITIFWPFINTYSEKKLSFTKEEEAAMLLQKVIFEFQEAAKLRNEELPQYVLENILLKFMKVYEIQGKDFCKSHLSYEIDKYIREGLREDYKIKR